MSTHTPPPWKMLSDVGGPFITASDEVNTFICRMGTEKVLYDNAAANAQLICAAPCLLEALQGLLEQLPSRANTQENGYGKARQCFYLRKLSVKSVVFARAAIKKATGE